MELTIREWFKAVQEEHLRKQLLANIGVASCDENTKYKSLHAAINAGFSWLNTPEGHPYWDKQYLRALDNEIPYAFPAKKLTLHSLIKGKVYVSEFSYSGRPSKIIFRPLKNNGFEGTSNLSMIDAEGKYAFNTSGARAASVIREAREDEIRKLEEAEAKYQEVNVVDEDWYPIKAEGYIHGQLYYTSWRGSDGSKTIIIGRYDVSFSQKMERHSGHRAFGMLPGHVIFRENSSLAKQAWDNGTCWNRIETLDVIRKATSSEIKQYEACFDAQKFVSFEPPIKGHSLDLKNSNTSIAKNENERLYLYLSKKERPKIEKKKKSTKLRIKQIRKI